MVGIAGSIETTMCFHYEVAEQIGGALPSAHADGTRSLGIPR
jgi:hypothetical protein